jgi:8-oxo-dGTP pyrophosphatase MutT (NUDIX family)
MTDMTKLLKPEERDRSHPNMRPKDAATLILVDRSEKTPKVLLGKRHHKHVFMPGKFVFPGGRAEPNDRLMPIAKPLHKEVETRLMREVSRPSATKARGLALAAIRETFEETGLLLGAKHDAARSAPDGPWSDFAKTGFYPDLSVLHFVARAITPPGRPRRFDARFFSVDASSIAHRIDNVVHADAELVELVWVPIAEAAQNLDLPTITTIVLQELQARVEAGFGHDLPVPFYRKPHDPFGRELL